MKTTKKSFQCHIPYQECKILVVVHPQLCQDNVPTIFAVMYFRLFFAFFLFATHQKTIVLADSDCYAKWLGGKFPPISECDLVEGTLTVRLENLVDRPDCLNEETLIGYKFNQQVDDVWDDSDYLDENSLFVFNSTKNLCQPLNVTIALSFFDGNDEWPVHKVKYLLNPVTCINKNLSDIEKEKIKKKCPNLTLNTFLTTTEASTSQTTTLEATTTAVTTKTNEKNASIDESERTREFAIFLFQHVSCSFSYFVKLLPSSYCHKMR